jgi:hypothetical protein
MNKQIFLAAALVALSVSGCIREEKAVTAEFRASEHEPFLKDGTGTITGQAFLRQQGGSVVRCSGEPVLLVPATSFFREAVGIHKSGYRAKLDLKLDDRMQKIARKGVCDADGKFKFERLPSGSWYIVTQVKWSVGSNQQGGELLGEAVTKQNSSVEVILADSNRV